mmetsp:Transcript_24341/g.55519  ORF Transcript_24341/g.55519 Transcript_24341/m.55519 type:complete len:796 (-) Transcript_24341:205-2592(-)
MVATSRADLSRLNFLRASSPCLSKLKFTSSAILRRLSFPVLAESVLYIVSSLLIRHQYVQRSRDVDDVEKYSTEIQIRQLTNALVILSILPFSILIVCSKSNDVIHRLDRNDYVGRISGVIFRPSRRLHRRYQMPSSSFLASFVDNETYEGVSTGCVLVPLLVTSMACHRIIVTTTGSGVMNDWTVESAHFTLWCGYFFAAASASSSALIVYDRNTSRTSGIGHISHCYYFPAAAVGIAAVAAAYFCASLAQNKWMRPLSYFSEFLPSFMVSCCAVSQVAIWMTIVLLSALSQSAERPARSVQLGLSSGELHAVSIATSITIVRFGASVFRTSSDHLEIGGGASSFCAGVCCAGMAGCITGCITVFFGIRMRGLEKMVVDRTNDAKDASKLSVYFKSIRFLKLSTAMTAMGIFLWTSTITCVFIEAYLRANYIRTTLNIVIPLPLFVHWIHLFLTESEFFFVSGPSNVADVSRNTILPENWLLSLFRGQETLEVPRYVWLLYWFAVLTVAFPGALILANKLQNDHAVKKQEASSSTFQDDKTQKSLVVLARKYFHLIAVFLFFPTTILSPDMMNLAYTVAVVLLVLVECSRCCSCNVDSGGCNPGAKNVLHYNGICKYKPNWWKGKFYAFLDEKDNATVENYQEYGEKSYCNRQFVVTHIALILGCALPAFVRSASPTFLNGSLSMFPYSVMSLAGVLVLGIGDALGAVIGIMFGRTKWPGTSKTLEGSTAMFVGIMALVGILGLLAPDQPSIGFILRNQTVPFLLVTLLEAVTSQVDNICLPVFAAAMLLSSCC